MRGKLFAKIFVGFWLVTIAVIGSVMLANQYFEDHPRPGDPGRRPHDGPPHRFVLQLIYNLQNAPDAQLDAIVSRARSEHGIRVFLLDRNGGELLGNSLPAPVSSALEQVDPHRRRLFVRIDGQPAAIHRIYREEQGSLRAVILFPGPRHNLLGILGANLWLRLLLAVMVSGGVCYALSRLLTNRLRDLQRASRRLADGQLDTRLEVRERGGDETDELARDFNSMAEQLQQRILAQKRLLADVSHELRSPLARLRVALALAEEDQDNRAEYWQRIEREADRLEELIGQLLSSQCGDLPMDRHIDLAGLLRQLCADANFEKTRAGVSVRYDSALDQAVVASSGDLLRKSFENIIRNALHYSAEGSEVRVELTRVDGNFQVEIEDCGPGVPEAELAHIFDEFYRVDTARTREAGGYGLGLSIAHRAIRSHGGRLQARNTGDGLLVTVIVPVGD